jgi:hypothetical protein
MKTLSHVIRVKRLRGKTVFCQKAVRKVRAFGIGEERLRAGLPMFPVSSFWNMPYIWSYNLINTI